MPETAFQRFRGSWNFTQEYIAKIAGVSRRTVVNWDHNFSLPTRRNEAKLLKALKTKHNIEITLAELFGR